MNKLLGITRFEIRYQLKNPVFWVAAAIFFLLGFGLTASENVSIGTPGAVHENAPYAIASATALLTLFYLFVITAFVANAIVRDDSSGFAPIVRATSVTNAEIVFGRFFGGLLVAWLGYLAVPLGMFAGSIMPWVDPETVGPQKLVYYLFNFAVFALPNIFLTSAILFALATTLRSMMASYIGVVLLVMGYLITISVAGQKIEYRDAFARFEPLGNGALRDATRYWTQADMNTRLIDFSGTLAFNRGFTILLGIGFLALTLWRFTMTERAPSKRALRKLARRSASDAKIAAIVPLMTGSSITARHAIPSRTTQFLARLRVEAGLVLTSPGTIVLTLFAIINTCANLWLARSAYGTSDHPTLAATIGAVRGGFTLSIIIIAVFYGGELVWRERDRKLNELIDSTPVPNWVMTVPKILAIFAVLLLINLAAMATGLGFSLIKGAHDFDFTAYFCWYIVPAAIDGLLIAVLAVFAQVLSPNKYVGWAIMFVWFVGSIFLANMGFSNPLYNYDNSPAVPLSDFIGVGSFWKGAALFQLYWAWCAIILAVIAHLLWPRGTDLGLRVRFRRARRRRGIGAPVALALIAGVGMAATGVFAYQNIKLLNHYETPDEAEQRSADYERKYLKYENLDRPVVTHVALKVDLFPAERRMIVDGRYDLANHGNAPISDVHIRQTSPDTEYLALDLAGAHLVANAKADGYRIYRFDRPLAPGATSVMTFRSRLWRRGFRANTPATDILENGTFTNNFEFAPIIGMDRNSLLSDRAKRRRQGLPAELRMAKLEDLSAARFNYVGADWVTSDVTFTTDAGQTPIAPGSRISDTTANGRRTAQFVSTAPIMNFFSLQSADYRLATRMHDGIKLSVYYHQGHDWNVSRMLSAMAAELDYARANFGPYQFAYARIIEFPGYASFAQAFAGTMPYSESIGFNADTSDPEKIDFTSYVVAHEMAHQYWAHQVVGASMQGGTMTSETLAQYTALMVMKRLYGPDKIRRFLKYELDQYLSSRKGEVVEELPLERVENQGYVHYRKGAVVMYLLQERLGEASVNRALARFLARFRFKGAPYERSLDLITEFRREAHTPEQQQLITDLFEKITLYDLKLTDATTKRDGDGWTTTLTIGAAKAYSSGKGAETTARLDEAIEVGLFTDRPGIGPFSANNVLVLGRQRLHDGTQKLTVHSNSKPTFAGVDPYNYYVDRNSDDNVRSVTAS